MTRRLAALVVPALLLALATGCAGPTQTGAESTASSDSSSSATPSSADSLTTGSADETPAPTPTETPTSTVTPTATPAADAPVITTAGYGDLVIGKPVPDSTTLVKFYKDQCYDGRWSTPGTEPKTDPITVRTEGNIAGGPIQWLSFASSEIQTKSGAHVGSTRAELEKLFPEATDAEGGALLVVADSIGKVVFEFESADDDAVAEIHVVGAKDEPFSALHGDAFGPCYGA